MDFKKEAEEFIQRKLDEALHPITAEYTAEFQNLVEKLLIAGFKGFWTGFDIQKISPQRFDSTLHAIPKSAYVVAQEYFNQMQKQIYESPANN